MSMCYLCDLCKHQIELRKWDRSLVHVCAVTDRAKMVAIDYGRDDPREICVHFEPKEGSE